LLLPSALRISSAPRYPIRGHQLGNRDVNNTYEAWTSSSTAYIRDLALFGANSIEIILFIADFPTERSNRVLLRRDDAHIVAPSSPTDGRVGLVPQRRRGVDEWIHPGDKELTDPAFVQKG
jgi:hypothetical protein